MHDCISLFVYLPPTTAAPPLLFADGAPEVVGSWQKPFLYHLLPYDHHHNASGIDMDIMLIAQQALRWIAWPPQLPSAEPRSLF